MVYYNSIERRVIMEKSFKDAHGNLVFFDQHSDVEFIQARDIITDEITRGVVVVDGMEYEVEEEVFDAVKAYMGS